MCKYWPQLSNFSDNERGGKSARDYQRKVAKVGMHPGVTRHLSAFKLGDGLYGPLYMVDTPGEWDFYVSYSITACRETQY